MVRKKTHEEYVEQLKLINPNVEVIGQYVNAATHVRHRCRVCCHEWDVKPNNILSGKGCPRCRNIKNQIAQMKPHNDYLQELKEKNIQAEPLEPYSGALKKIRHICLKHNVEWDVTPANVLLGHGCPQCKKEKTILGESKTHNEYVAELAIKRPDVEVCDFYSGANTKIKHKCKIHGLEWLAKPDHVLKGHSSCPECKKINIHNGQARSHDAYVSELREKNPKLLVLEEYIDAKTPILHKCVLHGFEWKVRPSSALQGRGCPRCFSEGVKERNRKTHKQYVQDLKVKNPNIEVLGTYVNAVTPIRHKCKIDGYEWDAKPTSLMSGYGCPKCHDTKGERKIRNWLENYGIKFETQKRFDDCADKRRLPFDFYIPDLNTCIEFDGEHHYYPVDFSSKHPGRAVKQFEQNKRHDQIKNDYCEENGIRLIRIPYWYYDDVDHYLKDYLLV